MIISALLTIHVADGSRSASTNGGVLRLQNILRLPRGFTSASMITGFSVWKPATRLIAKMTNFFWLIALWKALVLIAAMT